MKKTEAKSGEQWIADGKDGKATLVYNENDDRADAVIRCFGPDQQEVAERIVRLLNGGVGEVGG